MLQTGEDPGEIPKVPNIQIHGTRTAEITNILFPFLLYSCALHPTMKTIYHFYKETRDRAWEDQAVGQNAPGAARHRPVAEQPWSIWR